MKRFVLFAFLMTIFFDSFATDYYSKVSGSPSVLANWNTLPGGTGTAPPAGSFTAAGNKFIIQNGHTMTTTGIWTIGSTTSTLQIENGGVLQGDHLIQFTGTFQIDNGGKYVHNDFTTVGTGAGVSIWGGTEVFAANSTVEIQDWTDIATPLPAGITWGNLVINILTTIGGNWSQEGSLTTIQGDLQIRQTGVILNDDEFDFTINTNATVNIGGNLIVDGGILNIKAGPLAGSFCNVQVNGNIIVNGGTLNAGTADAVPNAELRFKGNFAAAAGSTITSGLNSYLVANGTALQTFACSPVFDCNFRIASSAIVSLSSAVTTPGGGRTFAVLGTFNDNSYSMTVPRLETAGGIFNSTGSLKVGINCIACLGDGTYNSVNSTWCTASGARGTINLTGNSLLMDNNISMTIISAGSFLLNSPGDIYFANAIGNSLPAGAFIARYFVRPGSIFSLDAGSYISGNNTFYFGQGGTLRIGSVDGISSSGNTGNVRTANRAYNSSGANSFEYFGSSQQNTGDGLPTTITGTLKINNSSLGTNGVVLSQATTISTGELDLTLGKLTTTSSNIITVGSSATTTTAYADNSFVNGPMIKYTSTSYKFPLGKGVTIHPAEIAVTSGGTTSDFYTAEYFNSPISCGSLSGGIHHVSGLEHWTIKSDATTQPTDFVVTLYATTYSDATDRSRLVIARCSIGTGNWVNLGNANTLNNGAVGPITSSTVVSGPYSPTASFTLASLDPYPTNPLPINLISFDATKLTNTRSSLNWELAACCSAAARFEVQRANADRGFSAIGTVNGNETNRFYTYADNGLKNGINYYRLKMIDADGKITFSRTVAVMNGVNGLLLTSLIPTMITNSAILTVASSGRQKLDLVITDIQGRIMQKQNHTISAGNSNIQLSTDRLPSGIYQLAGITSEGKTNMIRFIKQ